MDWLQKHWSNAVTLGCIVVAAVVEAWQQAAANVSKDVHIPRLQGNWNYVPLILLTVAGTVWLIGRRRNGTVPQLQTPQPPSASGILPGIPTLSALLGQNPSVEFDAKKFFALAYYSPITAEIEKNIQTIAQQNSPNDKEAFYARFIGVGVVAYQHDLTWFTIYGSQLSALLYLSSRGVVPVGDLKQFYDKATVDYPKAYTNYSFDQWTNYMRGRMILAVYPSQMCEISFNGKDFLKYLMHVGRDAHSKPN